MHKLKMLAATLAACLFVLTINACSKSEEGESQPAARATGIAGAPLLEYVPADTPYLLANLQSPPDEVQDRLESHADTLLLAYQRLIRAVAQQKAVEMDAMGDEDGAEQLLAISGPLTELMTLEGMRGAGFGRESTLVLYGDGLLPVTRVALTDGKLFEAALQTIEADAGQKMDTAAIDDVNYRYAGDAEGRVVIAVIDDDLVLSIVPAEDADEVLRSVFGLTMPARSIADTDIIADLQEEYGFEPYYLGFVDITAIAETFVSTPSGTNARLLQETEYDVAAQSDVCKAEIRELAGLFPRLVSGYTEFGAERFESNTILELRPDIAADLTALTAPVPGLGQKHGGLLTFGMSLNLLAAREFYAARLDAMEENPYKCEHFADLQAGVAKGREVLQQPVPPVVYDFKGFLAVVEELEGLDLASETPPTSMDLWMLLAMDNVEGLVAMGQMFNPGLAGLNLQPDGEPVLLDLPEVEGSVGTAHAAMTETALAISVGEGMESRLPDALEAATSDPSPFMTTEMDAGRYYAFLAEAMLLEDSDDEDPASPEVKASMAEIMNGFAEMLERVRVDVHFTSRGIEMPSVVELKQQK